MNLAKFVAADLILNYLRLMAVEKKVELSLALSTFPPWDNGGKW